MKKFYSFLLPLFFCLFAGNFSANATIDTLQSGSFIINMGITPQTIGNGLKPYGLVYKLVKTYKIPVKWVVNGSKAKDGIDFSHNGVNYRGGTFIIPFEFRTTTVNAEISAWEAQGVVGNTSVSTLILDVTKTIYYAPNWTMDKQNGAIVTAYFSNAGIPSSAYGGDPLNWKNPSELGACDDIFVMPHADPTWANHNNLHYWNRNHKGNLWVACHAVSELENMVDPVTGTQLNFLTTNGMVDWTLHRKDATPPYLYQANGDAVMQFMGVLDNATVNGSEKTFLPANNSAWRSTTTLGVYDESNENIPSLSSGPAAIIAYGRAYGDTSRGWVMYEAGHDHNLTGTEAERVAAQRAFFNYSFFVAVDRYADFNTSIEGLPEVIVGNQAYPLSFAVPPGIDLNLYTVQWSSSAGGTFTNSGNKAATTFSAPANIGATIITVTITDGCGYEVFSSSGTYVGGVLPTAVQLQGSYQPVNELVQLKWTETDNQAVSHYELHRADNNNGYKTIALLFGEEKGDKVNYSYTDKQAVPGINKYRLKIYSKSKAVSYSNTVKVSTGNDGQAQVSILGNPTRGVIAFEYQSPITESITAVIIDMSGRVLSTKKLMAQKGTSVFQVGNFNNHPAGMYLLKVTSGTKTMVSQVNLVK
jgi:hypothetical protein